MLLSVSPSDSNSSAWLTISMGLSGWPRRPSLSSLSKRRRRFSVRPSRLPGSPVARAEQRVELARDAALLDGLRAAAPAAVPALASDHGSSCNSGSARLSLALNAVTRPAGNNGGTRRERQCARTLRRSAS
jgi:hypothetical protein